MSSQSMLNAFADYEHAHALPDHHNIMQQYPGTRLYRVVRCTRRLEGMACDQRLYTWIVS